MKQNRNPEDLQLTNAFLAIPLGHRLLDVLLGVILLILKSRNGSILTLFHFLSDGLDTFNKTRIQLLFGLQKLAGGLKGYNAALQVFLRLFRVQTRNVELQRTSHVQLIFGM